MASTADPITLRFLGEERVFEPVSDNPDLWCCAVPGLGDVDLERDDDEWDCMVYELNYCEGGGSPQSAATALEDALRPLAKVLAPLLEKP